MTFSKPEKLNEALSSALPGEPDENGYLAPSVDRLAMVDRCAGPDLDEARPRSPGDGFGGPPPGIHRFGDSRVVEVQDDAPPRVDPGRRPQR